MSRSKEGKRARMKARRALRPPVVNRPKEIKEAPAPSAHDFLMALLNGKGKPDESP